MSKFQLNVQFTRSMSFMNCKKMQSKRMRWETLHFTYTTMSLTEKRNTKAYTHVVLPPRSTCMEMSKFRKTGLARQYPPTPSWPLWWQRQISAQTYRPIPQVITTGTWHKEREKQDRKKKKTTTLQHKAER